MTLAELNGVEVSSHAKAKTFSSWKVLFVEWGKDKEERYLVINRLNGRVLKMEESQQLGFWKSGVGWDMYQTWHTVCFNTVEESKKLDLDKSWR